MDDDQTTDVKFPELRFIPEQMVAAGSRVEIPFYQFARMEEGRNYEFSVKDFPEGLSIDPKSGVLSGTAPKTELNQSYLCSVTLTDLDTDKYAQSIFRLEVIGSLLLDTVEGKAFFANEELNFWDAVKTWELQLFIQQMIIEHFAWVVMYDATQYLGTLGEFQSRREAKSGWEIIVFENAVMITPGNKAFEQYGNRKRILDTLREAFNQDVATKSWQKVLLDGSDVESVGKAWVIAKELNIPVDEVAPSDVAEINFYNLNRIYSGNTPSKKKLQLGS